MVYLIRRKAAARMLEKLGQTAMQPVELNMIAIGHLVKEPQNPMHGDLFGSG